MPRKNKVKEDDSEMPEGDIPLGCVDTKTVKVTLLSRCGDMGVFVDVNGKRYRFNKDTLTVDVEEADLSAFKNPEIFRVEET